MISCSPWTRPAAPNSIIQRTKRPLKPHPKTPLNGGQRKKMYGPSRLRLHHRLSRCICSPPNPNPNPIPNPDPSSRSMRSTIRALFKEDDPDRLAAEFKRFSDSPRFRRKSGAYEVIVLRLSAAGRPDAVEDILEHQKRYPSDFAREDFATRLIALYGRAGMLDHASAAFRQLPSLPCPRTVYSFNALLSACARAKDTDRIAELFREIPSSDPSIVPDTVSYNILISTLCENGVLDAALDTLDLMEKSDVAPDVVTFNTLLNGFYRKGRFADGERIWALMSEKGVNPDIVSYNSKLRALVSEGKVSEAVELVNELRCAGLKPDTFSFNALIKGFCQDGNWKEAKRAYRELKKVDCDPNRWTFETLIPALCKAGQINLALKLCNESINSRCFVDAGVLQEVVDKLVQMKRLEAAEKLVSHGMIRSHLRKNLKAPLACLFK